MTANFERALILIEQSRWEMAIAELGAHLAQHPDDATARTFLAVCHIERKEHDEALEQARRAVADDPNNPFPYYTLARAFYDIERIDEAERAIRDSLRLAPHDADSHAFLAQIHFHRREWQAAHDEAVRGLEIDAEHLPSLNLRAMSLRQLGRVDEAAELLGTALGRDPESAATHANQGWHHVEKGEYDEAMAHFREALRIDPELEWARSGVLEVMRARNPIYRLMLRYFLWSSKLENKRMWMVIIGGFLFARVLGSLQKAMPEYAGIFEAVMILYLIFVFLTWTARPFFDLFLRLSPTGRLILTKEQTLASNVVGLCLAVALVSGIVALATGSEQVTMLALGAVVMIIPAAGALTFEEKTGRRKLIIYTATLATLGAVAFILSLAGSALAATLGPIFFLGAFAFGWYANYLAMKRR